MKIRRIFILILTLILCITCFAGCAAWNRELKSFTSDLAGGLNRTVTVYDYNGNEIRSWSGKIDISESDNETWFDLNGKRTIIQGGIIIIQED